MIFGLKNLNESSGTSIVNLIIPVDEFILSRYELIQSHQQLERESMGFEKMETGEGTSVEREISDANLDAMCAMHEDPEDNERKEHIKRKRAEKKRKSKEARKKKKEKKLAVNVHVGVGGKLCLINLSIYSTK